MSVKLSDYQTLFEVLPAHAMILDRELRFVDVNDTFVQNTGVARKDLIGRFVFDVFPAEDNEREPIEAAFRKTLNGEATRVENLHYAVPDPKAEEGAFRDIWWTVSHAPITDETGAVTHLVQIGENVTEQVKNQQLKDAVLGELQHRMQNLYTLVLSIAKQTADHEDNFEPFLKSFTDRIRSLSTTQNLFTGRNWNSLTLGSLVASHLAPFDNSHGDRITVNGPDLEVSPDDAQAISMALHELTTNAVKYGAFAHDGGTLSVSWTGEPRDDFEFSWREDGLKDVAEPTRLGFGSMILTRIFPSQMDGEAARQFADTSFTYKLRTRLPREG